MAKEKVEDQTSDLQLYVDTQLVEISPFEVRSNELLKSAKALEITDAKTVREASAIRKQITGHVTATAEARKDITRQFNDVVSQFIDAEKKALKPAEEAKKVIQKKILDFEEAENKRKVDEENRIADIIRGFGKDVPEDQEDETVLDEMLVTLEDAFAALNKEDAKNPELKHAYASLKSRILSKLDELMLGADSDEAEIATASADVEDAELELKTKARAAKSAPKLGIKMITKFEITDADAVPRVLCEPVDKLIRAFIKENPGSEIPGVRIYEEKGF